MPVTVDVTPNGRGDAVTRLGPSDNSSKLQAGRKDSEAVMSVSSLPSRSLPSLAGRSSGEDNDAGSYAAEWFVTPEERRMTLRDFFSLLRQSRGSPMGEGSARSSEIPYIQVSFGIHRQTVPGWRQGLHRMTYPLYIYSPIIHTTYCVASS